MKKITLKLVMASLLLSSSSAFSAWTDPMKVTAIQVVEHGGFLISFDKVVNSACVGSGDTRRVYVYPNQAGLTSDGVKAMLSTTMVALTAGLNVSIMYSDSSRECWVQYLVLSK